MSSCHRPIGAKDDSGTLCRRDCIHILHVDDDVSILEVSKKILALESGLKVSTASSVDEAFKKLSNGRYDVIVSDYDMPQRDGLHFLEELREHARYNKIPFILFSGTDRAEVAMKALNLGADGYYDKQSSPEKAYGELACGIRLTVEKAKAKSALKASEKRYRMLMRTAPDAIFVHNEEGKILDLNQQACKSLGYTIKELLSMNAKNIFPFASKNKQIDKLWAKALAGQSVTFESSQKRKDKSTFPTEVKLSSLILDKEKLVVALVRDITKRKETEALKKSEEQLRYIFNSLPDLVFFKNKDLKYVAANKALERHLGLKPGETIGKSDFELLPNTVAQGCFEADEKALKVGLVYAEERVGDSVYSVIRQKVIDISGNIIGVVGSIRDITERAKAEEKLKKLKAFDERIINSLGDALLIIDPDDYKIISVNEAALNQMNLTKNDVIGKTCYEITHNTSTPCQPPNDTCPIQEVLETGVPVKVEHVHIDKDNHERIVEVFARPVNNPEGKTVIIHVASDVTERKKAEAKNKEDSIRIEIMNEKLRVVGGLSRHDVRNKLFLVTGNMYLLKKKYSAHKDIMDSIEKIEQAVKDSMKIFEFAKMYEQLGVEKLFYIDVEKALNEAVALFSDLRFKVINNCLGLTVLADSFLRQLFYNLIDNTKKYGKKTTTIRLFYEKVRPGELRLIYEDDGVGISTENKLKLFTEGFSTGGSTGFGLYLIKKMVDIYGWSVKETGEPNKGVKFTITIPQFNQSGKENFHIKARYDSKSKIDKSSYLVHISNSQETYSQANDNSRGMVHLDGSIGDELVE